MIRNIFLITILFLLFSGIQMKAQYRQEAWIISPKISFADYSDQTDWAQYSISKVPPISFFAEKGLNPFLSAGGFLSYHGDKYAHDTIPDNVMRYKTYGVGAVASIHYAHWIEQLSGHSIFLGDFDLYVSAAARLEIHKTDEQYVWDPEEENFSNYQNTETKFRIRPIFGLRYFLTERFCMLAEVGKGNPGMVTTGVSWYLE